jgi:hypothetical protein
MNQTKEQKYSRSVLAGWRQALFSAGAAAALMAATSAQAALTMTPLVPNIIAPAGLTNTFLSLHFKIAGVNGTDYATNVVSFQMGCSNLTSQIDATFPTPWISNNAYIPVSVMVTNAPVGEYPLTFYVYTNGSADPIISSTVTLKVWNGWYAQGTSATIGQWSNPNNWSTGVSPVDGGDVVFGERSAVTTNSLTSATPSSLALNSLAIIRSTSNATNTFLMDNVTLSVFGTNGFVDNADAVYNDSKVYYTSFIGTNASLVVSNPAASFSVASISSGNNAANFDMSRLDNFFATVNRFGVAAFNLIPAGVQGVSGNQSSGGSAEFVRNFYFAKTNVVNAGYVRAENNDNGFLSQTNAIALFDLGDSSNGSQMNGYFGNSNLFLAGSLIVWGGASGSGANAMAFSASAIAANPVAVFRNTDGGRMSFFGIGVQTGPFSQAGQGRGILNFSGGKVDLLTDTLWMGHTRSNVTGAGKLTIGNLTFDKGRIDANNVYAGFALTNVGVAQSTITINGTNAVMAVNNTLFLGYSPSAVPLETVNEPQSFGRLNINSNGTAQVNQILVGTFTTNNTITVASAGNLIVTNTLATLAQGLKTLTLNNGTLTLFLDPAKTNVYVDNLVCSGNQNFIRVAALNNIGSYPVTISVIAYTNTTTPNLAVVGLPSGYYGRINNNTANKTIDITIDTAVPKTLSWRGGASGYTAVWNKFSYNWYDTTTGLTTNFNDGDAVVFDGYSGAPTTVTVAENVSPRQDASIPGITVDTTSTITLTGSGLVQGGALLLKTNTGTLVLDVNTDQSLSLKQGTVVGTGNASVGLVNTDAGTLLGWAGGGSGSINASVAISGVMTNGGNINASVSLRTGGILTNCNGGTITGTLSIGNASTLYNAGSLLSAGSFTVNTNAVLINAGTIEATSPTVAAGGTFTDLGSAASSTIKVDGTLSVSGTFIPGGSGIGTTLIKRNTGIASSGRFLLNNGGTLVMKVNTSATPTSSFLGANTIDLANNNTWMTGGGGRIQIVNLGPALANGNSFTMFGWSDGSTPANVAGTNTFPFMQPAIPGDGLAWDTTGLRYSSDLNGFAGTLAVTGFPTMTNSITKVGGDMVISVSWPTNLYQWRLQEQTNSLSVGLSTNWFTVAGSITNTSITITNFATNNIDAAFFRMVYP